MKVWLPVCALLFVQDKFPVTIKSPHYELKSTATEKNAAALLEHMELVFATYTKLLGLAKPPAGKMTIVLYKDIDEYEASGAPSGSVAHYDLEARKLVGYADAKTMFNYFAHEGFHQFTDAGLKSLDKSPPWFTEGMAECIGNSVVRDRKLFMGVKDGVIAIENIGIIRAAVNEGKHVSIAKLLAMDDDAFQKQSDLLYPEAWSFCHFLLAYPEYENPKNQIPNGQYWTVLSNYITFMSKAGTAPEEARKASFVMKGKAIDLAELEKEWKDYVLKWPVKGEDEK
jgi:hypothetical protein